MLNNDVNKAVVEAEGLFRGFRRLINLESAVAPEQNNEADNPGNPNPAPVRIPTSSRNISELENRVHRHSNNFCQATSVGFTDQRLYAVEDTRENMPGRRDIDR